MNGGEPLSSLIFFASTCEVTNGDLTYTIFDMNNEDHCEASAPVFFQQHTSTVDDLIQIHQNATFWYLTIQDLNFRLTESFEKCEFRIRCSRIFCYLN